MLKYTLASIASAGVLTIAGCQDAATIGGTKVPTELHCKEDEVITFIGVDTLGCVHYEEVN